MELAGEICKCGEKAAKLMSKPPETPFFGGKKRLSREKWLVAFFAMVKTLCLKPLWFIHRHMNIASKSARS
ncbi:MAG: hypothetical protein ACOX7I_06460 [Oscillospiraceae bacterium]|jgi:hypothetical protein